MWERGSEGERERERKREAESESEGEGTATCFAFLATLDTLFVFCILVKSTPTSLHLHTCVLQATPGTLTHLPPSSHSPALLQLHCAVLLAKFAAAFCRDKLKSEAEEIGNLILFSCPATPQRPPTPSLNACHFCPFSAVSFSPRTVCAKNLIIETLSELEKWNDTNENQPQSDKATK